VPTLTKDQLTFVLRHTAKWKDEFCLCVQKHWQEYQKKMLLSFVTCRGLEKQDVGKRKWEECTQVAAVPDAMQFSTRYGVLLWLPQNPSARSFSLRFCFQTYLAHCTLKIHNAKVSGECPKGVGI